MPWHDKTSRQLAALAIALLVACGDVGRLVPGSHPSSTAGDTPVDDPTSTPTEPDKPAEDPVDGLSVPPVGSFGPDPGPPVNGPAWLGFGGDAQRSALAQVASQDLNRIRWQTAVDMAPQYNEQGYLLVHYGSPAITSKNTVIVPVKSGAQGNFLVRGLTGYRGERIWEMSSDYVMPAHHWMPAYNVTLTLANRVYAANGGGRVLFRDNPDSSSIMIPQSLAFYGNDNYNANKAAYDATVFVNTPITADSQGNIYFGFSALSGAPGGLQGGIARIAEDGTGQWASAATLTGDSAIDKAAMNSAPALSNDQKTLYVAVNGPSGKGYLLALDAATLTLKNKALLSDPESQQPATVSDDSTASPTIGPDGDVFFGVLESSYALHNARGWLLHFDATLAQSRLPGSFGWDTTASIVPASMVAAYNGPSQYLVITSSNNYSRAGSGDGKNQVALLDPNVGQSDVLSPSVSVMKDVMTILGVTPDPNYPGGVIEWCFNKAAVDPATKSVLMNSEDGWLYRWDLTTNTLAQKVRLTSGLGEAYTPSAIGADGTVYVIDNAVLFAIGK